MKVKPPNAYEVEKLRRMTEANRAELQAIKADQEACKWIDQNRVRKLHRAVKEQVRLERELNRRAAKAAAAAPAESPAGLIAKIADEVRAGAR